MDLKGKKINCLGDSITEGYGTTHIENTYWNRLAASTGATVRGYGIGGTRIARQHAPSENPLYDRWFCSRVSEMDPDADVIVVFGGTNDFGTGDAPLGPEDSRDEYTFYGGLNILCDHLKETFPTAKIVFMTPLHRCGEDNLRNKWGIRNVCPLSGYVKIIKKVCRKNDFSVIDCYSLSVLDPNKGDCKERYIPDGLHPNDEGHTVLSKFVLKKLKAIPKHSNPNQILEQKFSAVLR